MFPVQAAWQGVIAAWTQAEIGTKRITAINNNPKYESSFRSEYLVEAGRVVKYKGETKNTDISVKGIWKVTQIRSQRKKKSSRGASVFPEDMQVIQNRMLVDLCNGVFLGLRCKWGACY